MPRRDRSDRLRSRWRPGYWMRHPLLSLILVGVFAVVFLLMAGATGYDNYRLNQHGRLASATVVDVRADYVVVRFTTADEQEITTRIYDYWWNPVPRPGDTATIVYDPEQPGQVLRDTRISGDYTMSGVLLALAVALGVGGTVFLRRTWGLWRANAEAWRTSDHVA